MALHVIKSTQQFLLFFLTNSLACECAEKAKSLKYAYFAIGFYGECFAGKDRLKIFTALSQSSKNDQCIKGDFNKCESDSEAGKHECVGTASHEYIYSIKEDIKSDDNNSKKFYFLAFFLKN